MNHDNTILDSDAGCGDSEKLNRMAPAHDASNSPSRGDRIETSAEPATGPCIRANRTDASPDGDHQRSRYRAGIPQENLADQAFYSFESGDPKVVHASVSRLAEAYRELHGEAAKLRFQLNFGTPICSDCDGLKAGPGVVATCFQVRKCNYENVREDQITDRHQRILQSLDVDLKIPS